MNFTIDQLLIAVAILFVTVLVLAGLVVNLHLKLKKFLIGSDSENLGETITSIDGSLKEFNSFKKDMENYLTTVEARVRKSVQGVHTVRFNPFAGTTNSGGNQSFATAFLNEAGDGVVVSTLYARERVSIYSKPVVKGVSEYELSAEEKEAIHGALKLVKS